jgi:membrane-associated protease RseP (regulator of RpoE activity)
MEAFGKDHIGLPETRSREFVSREIPKCSGYRRCKCRRVDKVPVVIKERIRSRDQVRSADVSRVSATRCVNNGDKACRQRRDLSRAGAKGRPAAKAGIHTGDILISINGATVANSLDVAKILTGLGAWSKCDYLVRHQGIDVKTPLIVGEVPRDPAIYYLYFVGLSYLAIGLFVLLDMALRAHGH